MIATMIKDGSAKHCNAKAIELCATNDDDNNDDYDDDDNATARTPMMMK